MVQFKELQVAKELETKYVLELIRLNIYLIH